MTTTRGRQKRGAKEEVNKHEDAPQRNTGDTPGNTKNSASKTGTRKRTPVTYQECILRRALAKLNSTLD